MTEIIVGERGSGKTSELIRRSAETGIYILVANHERARYLAKQAREMGFHIPFPITLEEYNKCSFRSSSIRRDGIYIDDMDDVVAELFGKTGINAVTLTKRKRKVTDIRKRGMTMGLADAFGSEDRVNVKYSDFYNLVKGCTERDMILNGIKTETPNEYILQMVTGEKQKSESGETDGAEDQI